MSEPNESSGWKIAPFGAARSPVPVAFKLSTPHAAGPAAGGVAHGAAAVVGGPQGAAASAFGAVCATVAGVGHRAPAVAASAANASPPNQAGNADPDRFGPTPRISSRPPYRRPPCDRMGAPRPAMRRTISL